MEFEGIFSEGEMAERVTQKRKQPAASARRPARSAPVRAKRTTVSQVEALERERDQLKAQLAAAQAQLTKLEQARDDAVNRIDWALDSLHNLLENSA